MSDENNNNEKKGSFPEPIDDKANYAENSRESKKAAEFGVGVYEYRKTFQKLQTEKEIEKEQIQLKKEQQEMRLRMMERDAVKKVKKSCQKVEDNIFNGKGNTPAQQLEIIQFQLINRLIDETRPSSIDFVDWHNQDSRSKRKAQLGNIKDQISIIKQLTDVIDITKEREKQEKIENGEKPTKQNTSPTDNALKQARKHLKQVGLEGKI